MIDKCPIGDADKCSANDLQPCDFKGTKYQDCLRYKVKNLRTEFTQLR